MVTECKKLYSIDLPLKLKTMLRRIFNLLHKNNSITCPLYHLHLSTSASAAETLAPKPTFIVEYLINSCGFSPEEATAASKPISRITSPDRPDSVTHFLKHQGFADAQIRTLIFRFPSILRAKVDTTVGPNLTALRKMGFAEDDLHKIVLSNPAALLFRSAASRLEFWRTFLRGDMTKLIVAFTRNLGLINLDTGRNIAPKIALLKSYGLSETNIGLLLVRGNSFFRKSTFSMETVLKRSQELGFPHGSRMFVLSLSAFSGVSSDRIKAKMEIYKSFGWSQGDINSMLLKFPAFIRLSEENIRKKMEFLVGRAGCTPTYVCLHPVLLGYSLEKRLIPRHLVLEILKSMELAERDRSLYCFMVPSEKNFLKNIIQRYEDRVPMLLQTYSAACAGKLLL